MEKHDSGREHLFRWFFEVLGRCFTFLRALVVLFYRVERCLFMAKITENLGLMISFLYRF